MEHPAGACVRQVSYRFVKSSESSAKRVCYFFFFDCYIRGTAGETMTKAELIRALENLPDDTEIYVPSREVSDTWVHAWYVEVDCDGSDDCQAEVSIVGTD